MVSRTIPLPGVRLGKSLAEWLNLPKESPGRDDYLQRVREVDCAERVAYQAAQGVIVR